MTIQDLLQYVIDKNGSDLHLIAGSFPMIRVDEQLFPVEDTKVLITTELEELIFPLLTQEQKDYLLVNKETDFGYQLKDLGRFRVNVYYQRGSLAAALRLIPLKIHTIDELHLPPIFHQFAQYRQGLILLTGPTGEGKSSSIAAILDEINYTQSKHIVTIEDPVEFMYTPQKSLISQRELQLDTHSWSIALRSVLREDPDVVLIGEMRDFETISAAMTIAETGHLVFASLHTNSAAQTVDRIIDVFPEAQQGQIRQQLAQVLQVIVAQRLIPATGGGRVPAVEVLVANSAVRNLIREQKAFQLDNVIQTAGEENMITIESSLLTWANRGIITFEKAREYAFRPQEFDRLASGSGARA